MSRRTNSLLPHIEFSILLALSLKQRHGYEIMQQVEHDSDGVVKLGPGALYGAIKQLSEDNLIEEVPSETPNDRRKYYRLTRKGWNRLEAEIKYFESTMKIARQRRIVNQSSEATI
jgi:DNA-binding PadR family transcriptional regulator